MRRALLAIAAVTAILAVYVLVMRRSPSGWTWHPGDIGTEAPVAGILSGPDNNWFVLCQARDDTDGNGELDVRFGIHATGGDDVEPYLVVGTGPGERIDYPAANAGNWIAVVRSGRLQLIDAATDKRWWLDADVTKDGHYLRDKNARFVSFAANASRMTYLREHAIVIRDLPSGRERVIPVADKLWRATVDAVGKWAEVTVVRADTNGDGVIDWPGGAVDDALTSCGADVLHHINPHDGDAVTTRWLDLDTGTFVDDPTVIDSVGGELLHRTADGALVLGTTPIAGSACQLEGTIAVPPRVLVSCDHGPIAVAGPGLYVQTGAKTYGGNPFHAGFERVDDHTLVDLTSGQTIPLPGHVATFIDHYAVVDLGSEWASIDLVTAATIRLGTHGTVGDGIALFPAPIVTIGDELYDLRTGRRLGADDSGIVSVDLARHRRLRETHRAESGHAPCGPLRWDTLDDR